MPATSWDGYHRFCPLARGLDVVGDRWTMVVIHELLGKPLRFGELKESLPGIGNNLLSERLKRLEAAGLIERRVGDVGDGVRYATTERAEGLRPVFRELRRWGSSMQLDNPVHEAYDHDMSYVLPEELSLAESYEWRIGEAVIALTIDGHTLHQRPGSAIDPVVVVTAPHDFLSRWAAGDTSWQEARESGEVIVDGSDDAWDRMLLATAYPGRPADITNKVRAQFEVSR